MAFTEHQKRIADSMNRLMRKIDRTCRNWYVGVTQNPRKRMEQHKRNYSKLAHFTYYQTYSKDSACKIEKHFSIRRKTGNNPQIGGATGKSKYIYIFYVGKGLSGMKLDTLLKELAI